MPQETKNIIQLKESTSGPNFYPETHKAAIVGKETYSYLGEVVSPGGGGGGSTGGDKPLSVSPRQSVIVGKAIPFHPRKGKKYYFADGVIKIKTEKGAIQQNPKYTRHSLISFYDPVDDTWLGQNYLPNSHQILENYGGRNSTAPVLVTITEESPGDTVFDITTMAKISFPKTFTSQTESPFIEIHNDRVIITDVPIPTIRRFDMSDSIQYKQVHQVSGEIDYRVPPGRTFRFSGKLIACFIRPRISNSRRSSNVPANTYQKTWVKKRMKRKPLSFDKLILQWEQKNRKDQLWLFSVRRQRIGKQHYVAHVSMRIVAFINGQGRSLRAPFITEWRRG